MSQPPTTMKRVVMDSNPTKALQSKTFKHFRNPRLHQPFNQAQARRSYEQFFSHLDALSSQQQLCFNLNNKQVNKRNCKCLAEMDPEETTGFMLCFCSLPRAQQQIIQKQIIQSAAVQRVDRAKLRGKRSSNFRPFLVPVTATRSEALCQQSFMNLFSLRKKSFATLVKSLQSHGTSAPVTHGNTGNQHNGRGSNKFKSRASIKKFL